MSKLEIANDLINILKDITDCDNCPLTNMCDGGDICSELYEVIDNESDEE
jgi:hypothetical protein